MPQLQYGTKKIDYKITRSERKTLAINVYPNLKVTVVSPKNKKIEDIKKKSQ